MNQYNPLISVIVPIYNVEPYIEDCLESLHLQDYQHLEILLIDDGSTDGSAAVCKTYVQLDKRFSYFYKKNSGQSGARNFALDRCHGEYISFVDSDDLVAHNFYSVISKKLSLNIDIVQFGFYYGTTRDVPMHKFSNRELTSRECLSEFLLYGPDVVWCRIFSSKLFENIRFKEGIIKEDTYILPTLIKQARLIVSTDECLYFYRQRVGSTMNSGFSRKLYDTMVVYEHVMRETEFDKNIYSIAVARSIVAMANLYSQFVNDRNFTDDDKRIVIYKGREYLGIYKRYAKYADIKLSYRFQIFLFSVSPRLCSFVLHLNNKIR